MQGRPPAAGEMTEQEAEELRLRRIQEKNRRNQRKFRARQRVRMVPCHKSRAMHASCCAPDHHLPCLRVAMDASAPARASCHTGLLPASAYQQVELERVAGVAMVLR